VTTRIVTYPVIDPISCSLRRVCGADYEFRQFVGCWRIPGTNMGFPLGWQGIVPFKFKKMIAIATDLILNRLINMKVLLYLDNVWSPGIK